MTNFKLQKNKNLTQKYSTCYQEVAKNLCITKSSNVQSSSKLKFIFYKHLKIIFSMLWCGLFFSNETNEGLTCNITLDIHKTDADSVYSLLSVSPSSKLLYMCGTLTMDNRKKYQVSLNHSQQTSQPKTQTKERKLRLFLRSWTSL